MRWASCRRACARCSARCGQSRRTCSRWRRLTWSHGTHRARHHRSWQQVQPKLCQHSLQLPTKTVMDGSNA